MEQELQSLPLPKTETYASWDCGAFSRERTRGLRIPQTPPRQKLQPDRSSNLRCAEPEKPADFAVAVLLRWARQRRKANARATSAQDLPMAPRQFDQLARVVE